MVAERHSSATDFRVTRGDGIDVAAYRHEGGGVRDDAFGVAVLPRGDHEERERQ
ncbi:hypothetical protein [Halopiger xanaduensis]|uniref:hypothetical protein n=1 Tax=Halopiger xanaduensis TaxID=387343 RepID=UPI0014944A82|nr:hypothetical protein [Halopiger xanaduensis]